MRPASALGSWTRLVAGHVPRYRRSTSAATVAGCPGNAGWRGLAPAAVVAAGLFCAPSCVASELSEPARQADNEAAERALTALRAAWFGEIAQLTSTARSLAMAADCADFVVRPNLPYVRDNFRREQLAAARIDTVLIVNGAGRPLFWRRVEPGRHVGFADATAFLATAISVLAVNAVIAVAIGCSVYALKFVYARWVRPESGVPAVGQASWPVP